MSQVAIISTLLKSLLLTIKNLPVLIVISLISFVAVAGPIGLFALGVGYLAQYPEWLGTEGPDGELVLTWLGHFIMWHGSNDWFLRAVTFALTYLALSWLCISWLRRLSGMGWFIIPFQTWIWGVAIIFVIFHGRFYIGTLYPSNTTLTYWSALFTLTYFGLRLAPALVRASQGRRPMLRSAFEQLKPFGFQVFVLAVFFIAADFLLEEAQEYIETLKFGSQLVVWSFQVFSLIAQFWFLSAVFLLGNVSVEEEEVAEEAPAT